MYSWSNTLELDNFIQDYFRETLTNFLAVPQESGFFISQKTFHKSKNSVSGMKNQLGIFISRNPIEIDNLSA